MSLYGKGFCSGVLSGSLRRKLLRLCRGGFSRQSSRFQSLRHRIPIVCRSKPADSSKQNSFLAAHLRQRLHDLFPTVNPDKIMRTKSAIFHLIFLSMIIKPHRLLPPYSSGYSLSVCGCRFCNGFTGPVVPILFGLAAGGTGCKQQGQDCFFFFFKCLSLMALCHKLRRISSAIR